MKEQDKVVWDEMQRDAAPDELEQAEMERDHWKQRAEAAEAREAKLREACEAMLYALKHGGIMGVKTEGAFVGEQQRMRQALKDGEPRLAGKEGA